VVFRAHGAQPDLVGDKNSILMNILMEIVCGLIAFVVATFIGKEVVGALHLLFLHHLVMGAMWTAQGRMQRKE
jgi:hypothetical protein